MRGTPLFNTLLENSSLSIPRAAFGKKTRVKSKSLYEKGQLRA